MRRIEIRYGFKSGLISKSFENDREIFISRALKDPSHSCLEGSRTGTMIRMDVIINAENGIRLMSKDDIFHILNHAFPRERTVESMCCHTEIRSSFCPVRFMAAANRKVIAVSMNIDGIFTMNSSIRVAKEYDVMFFNTECTE